MDFVKSNKTVLHVAIESVCIASLLAYTIKSNKALKSQINTLNFRMNAVEEALNTRVFRAQEQPRHQVQRAQEQPRYQVQQVQEQSPPPQIYQPVLPTIDESVEDDTVINTDLLDEEINQELLTIKQEE